MQGRHTKHSRPALAFVAALAGAVSLSAIAEARLTKSGDSDSGFMARAPNGLNITARTSELDVADDRTTVTLTVRLAYLNAGGDLLNKHIQEDLEVSKYPNATLSVPRSALQFGGGSGTAPGLLTIHGTTRTVNFYYVATVSAGAITVKGSATIGLSDYGVKPRTWLGITINNSVAIFSNFVVKDN